MGSTINLRLKPLPLPVHHKATEEVRALPIREYRCGECGCQFESIELGAESKPGPEKGICPICGSSDLSRRFSLFSSLKGDTDSSCSTKSTPRKFG
jgi:putative FmdB family regulatory protein